MSALFSGRARCGGRLHSEGEQRRRRRRTAAGVLGRHERPPRPALVRQRAVSVAGDRTARTTRPPDADGLLVDRRRTRRHPRHRWRRSVTKDGSSGQRRSVCSSSTKVLNLRAKFLLSLTNALCAVSHVTFCSIGVQSAGSRKTLPLREKSLNFLHWLSFLHVGD